MSYAYVPGVIGIQSNIEIEAKKSKKNKKDKKKSKSDSVNKSSTVISAKKSGEPEIKEINSTPKNISAPKSAIPESVQPKPEIEKS